MAPTSEVFMRTLENFKSDLTPDQLHNFQYSSLDDLSVAIDRIQKWQQPEHNLCNAVRLRRFLEAMNQFEKVADVFVNASEFVPFVWVSMDRGVPNQTRAMSCNS